MNFDEPRDYWIALIYDSLTDNLDHDDKEKLNTWITLSKENHDLYYEIKEIHTTLDIQERYNNYDYEFAHDNFVKVHKSHNTRITFLKYVAMAAMLLLFYTAGMTVYNFTSKNNTPIISQISADKGSRTKTTLSDGTVVWLNSNSQLSFDKDFGDSDRRVILTGEAYFDVKRDEKKPFIVETPNLNIQVLGTSFDVSSDKENKEVRVMLVSGSVELISNKGHRHIMKPDEMVVYNIKDDKFNLSNGIPSYELAWKEDKYIFKDKKFADITNELERIYDVKIIVNRKSLLNRKFTGDFINGESIHEIIQTMSVVGKYKYYIKGQIIEIQ